MKKILFLVITVITVATTNAQTKPTIVDGSFSADGSSGELLYNGVKTRVLCLRKGYMNIPAINSGTALVISPALCPSAEINENGNGYIFWGQTKYNLDDMMGRSTAYIIILRINAQGTGFVPFVEEISGKWITLPVVDLRIWVLPKFNPSVPNPIPTLVKDFSGSTTRVLFDESVQAYFLN